MTSKYFNKKNNLKIVSIALFMSLVLVVTAISGVGGILLKNAKAAGADTVDIILGQKTVGNTVVASVCLLADTAINLGDTGIWLKYDNSKLTPNTTLTAKGIYDGPADLSGSFAPMTWNAVSGRTDTYSMKAIFNSNPAIPIPNSTAITNNTAGLFGTATFNIGSGAGSDIITIDNSGTGVLKRTTNTPLTTTVINFSGDCTAYRSGGGTVTTPTLGSAPATAITGTVGSSLPTITVTGSNLAANTPATFTPAGGTAIAGFITNGVFSPTAPATISSGSLTGARNGVLAVTTPTGVAPLNIPTNFSASINVNTPAIGTVTATLANPISGVIGSTFGSISLSGNTYGDNTPASFTPEGASIAITGRIFGGNFVAFANQPIPSGTLTGARVGILNIYGINLNVPTNFSVNAVPPVNNQPASSNVITITNNSSSSKSSSSSSSESKSTTVTQSNQNDNSDSNVDTIVLPKTGGIRKDTLQLESDSLPRTGGNNQIILAVLSIISVTTFFAVYQSVHKRKILKFDKETKVK
jgi:hypothetical protein